MSRQPSDSDNEDGGHDNRVRGTAEHDDGAVSPRADSTSPHSAVMDGTFDSAAADSFDVSMQSGAGRDDSMASAGGRGRRRGSYAARRDSITTNMHMAAEIGQMLLEKNQELEQERDELLRDMEHLRDRIDTLGHELAVTREGGHTFQARIESLQQDNLRLSLALAHAEQVCAVVPPCRIARVVLSCLFTPARWFVISPCTGKSERYESWHRCRRRHGAERRA